MGKEGSGNENLPKLNDSNKQQQDFKKSPQNTKKKDLTSFPNDNRPNPYAGLNFDTHQYRNAVLSKTFKSHMMAISSVAMHPKKSICATASDDFTWKVCFIKYNTIFIYKNIDINCSCWGSYYEWRRP